MTTANLTDMCKAVFGDIVIKAYRTDECIKYEPESCITIRNNRLHYDTEDFIIEFVNGSIVHFSNSEWASLERLDNKDANLQQT